MTENKKTNLIWFANTINNVNKIDIEILDDSKRYLRFLIAKPNVPFKKTISKNKIDIKKKYSEYNLYPYWKLYFRDNVYNKDMKQLFRNLTDSLLQYQPFFIINSNNFECLYGNLIKIKFYDYGSFQNSSNKYYIHFDILLDKSIETIPKSITNVDITVKSKLLPNSRYEYGFCGQLDGRFRNCSLHQYLSKGGGILDVHPWGYCQTFDKAKGNSNIKCKIDIGT